MSKLENRMDLVEKHFLMAGETISKMVVDFKQFEKEMENSFKKMSAKSKKHKLEMEKLEAESKKRNQKHEDEMKKMDAESKKRNQKHEDEMKKMDAEIKKIEAETKQIYKQIAKGKKELDKALKNMSENVGGIGNSNGFYAEEFFYTALEKDMSFAGHHFDYIHKNLFRYNKRKNLRGEYDIVLINHEAIIVFELKYKLTKEYVDKFYNNSLKKFKELFPEYENLKLYGAVASMSDPYNARQLASSYGLYVATKQAQKIKVIDKNVCEYHSDNLLDD